MKPLWFIGGIAVAAILIVGVGSVLAYQGSGAGTNTKIGDKTTQTKTCGCAHGARAGGPPAGGCAAGCTAGCTQCSGEGGCGGGCSGGCNAGR
jgi:hypothetical protein